MTFGIEFGERGVKRRDITMVEIAPVNSWDRLNEAKAGAELRVVR
jgi:hypothetical protein